MEVPVPGSTDALVVHAKPSTKQALVYLHGVCGDIHKIADWSRAASQLATVIAVRGDVSCGNGRYKWGLDLAAVQVKVKDALEAVRRVRHGQLDVNHVVLFGYSQGASRVQRLANLDPKRYPWLILGGAPGQPNAYLLRRAQAIAIFGGSREPLAHMRKGYEVLQRERPRVRFDVLEGRTHGEFGPDSPKLIAAQLRWILHPGEGAPQHAGKDN